MDIELRQLQRRAHQSEDEADKLAFVSTLLRTGGNPTGLSEITWVRNYLQEEENRTAARRKEFLLGTFDQFLASLFVENPKLNWLFTVSVRYDDSTEHHLLPFWEPIHEFPFYHAQGITPIYDCTKLFPDNELTSPKVETLIWDYVLNYTAHHESIRDGQPFIWAHREASTLHLARFHHYSTRRKPLGLIPAIEAHIAEFPDPLSADKFSIKFNPKHIEKYGGTYEALALGGIHGAVL